MVLFASGNDPHAGHSCVHRTATGSSKENVFLQLSTGSHCWSTVPSPGVIVSEHRSVPSTIRRQKASRFPLNILTFNSSKTFRIQATPEGNTGEIKVYSRSDVMASCRGNCPIDTTSTAELLFDFTSPPVPSIRWWNMAPARRVCPWSAACSRYLTSPHQTNCQLVDEESRGIATLRYIR